MPYTPVTRLSQQLGIIFSASIAGFMVMLDSYIVNISLPYIARYFNAGTSLVVLVALVYLVVLCGSIILFGKMADQFGVRKIFLTGYIIFTASSVLCGLSPNFYILLAARAIQGLGASMLFCTAISLITLYIPAEKRGWAFGIFSPINSLGVLVGNPLGGLITGLLSWNWIFLVNVPIGIAAILFALRQVPADPAREKGEEKTRFDYLGSVLSFAGLAVFVFVLNQGRRLGYGSPAFLGGIAFSAAAITAFILRERRIRDPLLDPAIFRDRNFTLALAASLTGMALLTGNGVLLPFYLIYIMRIKVELAGLLMMITPVVFSILSMMIGPASDRFSRTRLMSAGMIVGLVSSGVFALLIPLNSLVIIITFSAALGFAYALFITPNNNLVMSLAHSGRQSVSSSVYRLATNLGQILGILGMELAFTFSFPPHMHPTGHLLTTFSMETLTEGFRYSYVAGAVICLTALILSVFVKDARRMGFHETTIPQFHDS